MEQKARSQNERFKWIQGKVGTAKFRCDIPKGICMRQIMDRKLREIGVNLAYQNTCSIAQLAKEAQSHEIDHVKTFAAGTVALEIEWNNKDPFFDRDLENFKRLHADGAISLGIIVTRGATLQDSMKRVVRRFVDDNRIDSHGDMERIGLNRTRRQIAEVMKRVERRRNPISFRDAWVDHFVGDKFGAATTHWSKLQDRVQRGVGNPCPLVLIGLPESIVTFGEDPAEVKKLLDEGEQQAAALE